MNVLTKDEFNVGFDDLRENIEDGVLFIHPTDTIYGIGCDATHEAAVKNIRKVKERHESPFSVIAPSKDWIYTNCDINGKAKEWVNKLPGPYTLILKLKNKECIAPNVNCDFDTLGVRIPDHWFSEAVERLGRPCVTTSANKSGKDFMTSIDDLHPDIAKQMAFAIYEDEKKGRPSTVVDLTGDEPVVKKR
ncbi:threonylcarbamoyl-AMP synthase [Candidatus Woesearchaeota archaeon]|nr:threonylcarbamoyl-AMP synthase [Candidatus Woesearchaeota archaeon]